MNDFIRIKSDKQITIANEFLRDKNLSNKAKGVLAMILALPDSWDFSIKGMVVVTKDGEASLRSAINELKDSGYCIMQPVRIAGKIARWKYFFSGERLTDDLLCDFLKVENLKVENRAQYDNIFNEDNNKENKKRDNNKLSSLKKDDIEFDEFYKLYPLKKSKQCAVKVWNRLSVEDKKEAIDKLPAYIADCCENKRSFKYPSTYLSQRTWEDDFISSDEKEVPTEETQYPAGMDAEQWNEITMWMCNNVPLIAGKIDPISFGQMKDMAGDSKLFSELLKQVNEDFSLDSSHSVKSVFYKRLKEYRNGQKG